MKTNKLLTGDTGTGKTYRFFKDYSNVPFIAIFPCRQLAYEAFIKYGANIDASLYTGEVKIDGTNPTAIFAVYESAYNIDCNRYDVVFIDEFHFINDEDRGADLIEFMDNSIRKEKLIVAATATNNVDDEFLDEFNFEEIELKPFFEPPKKTEIYFEEFSKNIGKGMSTIVFTKYMPTEYDIEYYCDESGLDYDKACIISANTPPAERLQNQIDFASGKKTLAIATNVLAQGLNFPAQQVLIIANEYDSDEIIKQKLGRLGRYGFGIKECYYVISYNAKNIKKRTPNRVKKNRNTNKCKFVNGNMKKEFEKFQIPYSLEEYRYYKYSLEFLDYIINNENVKQEYIEDVQIAYKQLKQYSDDIQLLISTFVDKK